MPKWPILGLHALDLYTFNGNDNFKHEIIATHFMTNLFLLWTHLSKRNNNPLKKAS